MRFAILAICLLIICAGCVGSIDTSPNGSEQTESDTIQTPKHPTTPSSSLYDVDVERIEDLVHKKINERRQENGVDTLARNGTLDAVARYKSWDMAQRDYFAHTGPNGTTHGMLRGRYSTECPYEGQNLYFEDYLTGYSNPYPQTSLYNEDQIASDAVNGLFNSTGHRENALDPNYDSQGIGVFVDENGTVFLTQELCG